MRYVECDHCDARAEDKAISRMTTVCVSVMGPESLEKHVDLCPECCKQLYNRIAVALRPPRAAQALPVLE